MISLVNADSIKIPLRDRSVQMIATSPPYWNLRDYNLTDWEGGSPDCDHRKRPFQKVETSTLDGAGNTQGYSKETYSGACPKCGAVQIDKGLGLETLHDCLGWARGENCGACYVCRIRLFGSECWRVLKDDGVFFLNLGDSYAAGGNGSGRQHRQKMGVGTAKAQALPRKTAPAGLKPKDLAMIPARVALALQADGWWLRNDIIWKKDNCMPESVKDRFTRQHEYIFLLAKQERYYFDQDAVREPTANDSGWARQRENGNGHKHAKPGAVYLDGRDECQYGLNDAGNTSTRNRRTVWEVNTTPYPGAHFACWPPDLIEPMIKAGSCPGSIVLDPFAGSGTTGIVARRLGRQFIGLDLSLDYLINQARTRLELDRLEAWGNGRKTDDLESIMAMPLFANQQPEAV